MAFPAKTRIFNFWEKPYAFHLSQAHVFVDGDKRVAAAAMLIFLRMNNVRAQFDSQELIDLFLDIAGGSLGREDVDQWLRKQVD